MMPPPTKVSITIQAAHEMDYSDLENIAPVEGRFNLQGEVTYERGERSERIKRMSHGFEIDKDFNVESLEKEMMDKLLKILGDKLKEETE